jgi:glucan phosphoethanolaminetransferase (alkaline phosphatase superfamily)
MARPMAPGRGKRMIEASAPPRRPVIVWDLVLTIVLLVVMIGAALLASFFSFFLAFASDSCGAVATCDSERIATGMLTAMIGPLLVGLLALIAAVIVLVLKRIAFWIPIVGIVLIVGVFVGGAAITASGVPSAAP